jgi:hypothetical protein
MITETITIGALTLQGAHEGPFVAVTIFNLQVEQIATVHLTRAEWHSLLAVDDQLRAARKLAQAVEARRG